MIGVGSGSLRWSLNISKYSACVSHEFKSLTALHSDHYSDLHWQRETLRKEVMTLPGQRAALPPLAIKVVRHQALTSSPATVPCVFRVNLETLALSPWDLGGNWCEHHADALATAFAMRNKILCL